MTDVTLSSHFDDKPIGKRPDGTLIYDNAPTVVCVALLGWHTNMLLLIRRARMPGMGLWALPGGFQMKGESWEECAHRELWEETGIRTQGTLEQVGDIVTDEYGHNVLICRFREDSSWRKVREPDPAEVQSMAWHTDPGPPPDQWAFPLHRLGALRAWGR